MKPDSILRLIDAYLDGTIDDADLVQLQEWMRKDKVNLQTFARRMMLHQQLREAMLIESKLESIRTMHDPRWDLAVKPLGISRSAKKRVIDTALRLPVVALIATFVALSSGAIAFYLGRVTVDSKRISGPRESAVSNFNPSELPRDTTPRGQVVRLVNVTNCRWDETRSSADALRGSLSPGQSLHLIEGVAMIESTLSNGSIGRFVLEGPLAMSLTDQGMPRLNYGKLAGEFSGNHDYYTVGTPLGRVMVLGDSSIGVEVKSNEVELHVFAGAATLEVWSTGFLQETTNQLLSVAAGTSVDAKFGGDGKVAAEYGEAEENGFVTAVSLAASRLLISDDYVKKIRAAKPIGYWRFESALNGIVRNEVADRWHCRMLGDAVRLRGGPGNHVAEFGMTPGPGYLISDDELGGVIGESYSLEVWVKPSYFHNGMLFSLIEWSPVSPNDSHRFFIELCGPNPGVPPSTRRSAEIFPGRIRFVSRAAECYSASVYRLRSWQHIAAVKDKGLMRLYADGKQVGSSTDPVPLGNGLRVMMGQLYPRNKNLPDEVTARLYVGELDEVALYDRPLSLSEIQDHFRLGRPAQ